MIMQTLGVWAIDRMKIFQHEVGREVDTPALIEFLFGVDGYGIHIAAGYLGIGLISIFLGIYLQRKYPDTES